MTDKTLNHDEDLTPMQEYIIAGVVILLFGLLYWFLNHDWKTESAFLPDTTKLPALETTSSDTRTKPDWPGASATPAPTKRIRSEAKTSAAITTTVPAMPAVANMPPQTTQAPQSKVVEDATKTAAMQAEIDKLKAENANMKQAEAERIKAEQKASPEPSPATKQQTTETDIYTLPDGTEVKLAATGLEQTFKQAINNQEINQPLVFDNIYFDTGAIDLKPASDQQIKAIAALLNKHQDIKILVRGHTDNVGLPQANAQLSLLRANSVGLALVNLGIDRQRIRIMGMGDTSPLENNATEEGRQKNRRIDISIIE